MKEGISGASLRFMRVEQWTLMCFSVLPTRLTPPSLTFSRASCTSLKSSWAKTSITPSSVAVAALSRLALAAVVVMPVTAPGSMMPSGWGL